MPALSERDMRVLAFERGTWRTAGAKEQAIAEVLGITATRYYQLLNELIDTPVALRFDPTLVKRLRGQRARRQRVEFEITQSDRGQQAERVVVVT